MLAALVLPCSTFESAVLATRLPSSALLRCRTPLRLAAAATAHGESAVGEQCGRRAAVRTAVVQAAWVAGVALGGATHATAESDAAGKRVVPEDDMEFHQQWMYAKPQDILPYIYATAKEGQVDQILKAMDEFGRHYPMYKLGDEKGEILEKEIAKMETPPKNALELGTFLGYSALRTARRLAPGGKLHCIEFNPDHAQVASQVIKYAGLADRVQVIVGDSSQVLLKMGKSIGAVDYVLLDHRKNLYLPDLQTMEKLGLVVKGTLVVADNVIYPGTPEYLEYVGSKAWDTKLIDAKFEYDLWWKEGWSPKADALSFSRKLI